MEKLRWNDRELINRLIIRLIDGGFPVSRKLFLRPAIVEDERISNETTAIYWARNVTIESPWAVDLSLIEWQSWW